MSFTRIASLCLITALTLLALVASSARATPNWMTPATSGPGPGESVAVTGKVEKVLALLTKVGAATVEISCSAAKFVNALLEASGEASGKLHYEGCTITLNGKLSGTCKPHSPGAAEGLIETNALDGSIQLHEVSPGSKVGQLKLVPASGAVLVTTVLGLEGEENECAIGEKIDVSGTFFAKDANGEFEVKAQTHVFEAASLSGVLFGGNPATLDGSVAVSLSETGSWSGLGA